MQNEDSIIAKIKTIAQLQNIDPDKNPKDYTDLAKSYRAFLDMWDHRTATDNVAWSKKETKETVYATKDLKAV